MVDFSHLNGHLHQNCVWGNFVKKETCIQSYFAYSTNIKKFRDILHFGGIVLGGIPQGALELRPLEGWSEGAMEP